MGFKFSGSLLKLGLAFGGGAAIGALGVLLLSKGGIDLKKTAATLLSHGMDMKEKASSVIEIAKENVEDLAAEAQAMSKEREAKKEKA